MNVYEDAINALEIYSEVYDTVIEIEGSENFKVTRGSACFIMKDKIMKELQKEEVQKMDRFELAKHLYECNCIYQE